MTLNPNKMASFKIDPQRRAADPEISVAVTAHAGSGKTKTLVDRVARLLLRSVRPETILCVTYTKAAASEMQRRLFEQLGRFAIAKDEDLILELANLEGKSVQDYGPEHLSRARQLFALALETPGGLRIQTIHAFCEKLLRQFPLEAGISPGFRLLDDMESKKVLDLAKKRLAHLILQSRQAKRPENEPVPDTDLLSEAYEQLVLRLDHKKFEALFADILAKKEVIFETMAKVHEGVCLLDLIAKTLGQDSFQDPETLQIAFFQHPDFDLDGYSMTIKSLQESASVTDQKQGKNLTDCLDLLSLADGDKEVDIKKSCYQKLLNVFFTTERTLKKDLVTKKIPEVIKNWMQSEQNRIAICQEKVLANRCASHSFDVIILGYAYLKAYDATKTSLGALDFTDIIEKTRQLLIDRPSTAWVLYKLDGRIDHILLDEAQDTAPLQWDIIEALVCEFFAGEDGRTRPLPRSFFLVGDEKQSIFSFQGAAPEQLLSRSRSLQKRAWERDQPFEGLDFTISWRSTPQILDFVDAMFSGGERTSSLSPSSQEDGAKVPMHHIAKRSDEMGTVDLWPSTQNTPGAKEEDWDLEDESEAIKSGRQQLASRIAKECARIVSEKDQIHEKGGKLRPANPGDILILVKKRGPLFHEILKSLQHENIPLEGTDRLFLPDHLVYQDLLSLTRYALFPQDDLTLAEVLRSPFCRISEEDLYRLTTHPQRRQSSLQSEIENQALTSSLWRETLEELCFIQEIAKTSSPFIFYNQLLHRCDSRGFSFLQRCITRLGKEAIEVLDAILHLAQAAENRQITDLERFCDELEKLDLTLKREMDAPKGAVRLMTIHGAKGLEAPIVILADTVWKREDRMTLVLSEDEQIPLWLGSRRQEDSKLMSNLRQQNLARQDAESARLLYVALTRARDRLILCGCLNARTKDVITAQGWLGWLFETFEQNLEGQWREVSNSQGFSFKRFGRDPIRFVDSVSDTDIALEPIKSATLPDWVHKTAPPLARTGANNWKIVTTTGLIRPGKPSSGLPPLAQTSGLRRARRGTLIHKLLQVLPDVIDHDRKSFARTLLSKEKDLTPEQITDILEETLKVLEHPLFAEVFGPGSKAEVPLIGHAPELLENLAVTGRIDRMVVTKKRVLIIDFKTHRPPPVKPEFVDQEHVIQMGLYFVLLKSLFPKHSLDAGLIWTEAPKLMPLPPSLMMESLRQAGLLS